MEKHECPVCRDEITVERDGRLATHGKMPLGRCPGSRYPIHPQPQRRADDTPAAA